MPLWKNPVGTDEVAGVAARPLLQIILVIGLGLPELADRLDLGHHFAIPQPRGIHIGDRILGDALLLLVDIIETERALSAVLFRHRPIIFSPFP
jgi:hypothetical protein